MKRLFRRCKRRFRHQVKGAEWRLHTLLLYRVDEPDFERYIQPRHLLGRAEVPQGSPKPKTASRRGWVTALGAVMLVLASFLFWQSIELINYSRLAAWALFVLSGLGAYAGLSVRGNAYLARIISWVEGDE